MSWKSVCHAAAAVGCLLFSGTLARATSLCTIPNNVPLTVLPAGCDAILTNGPIFFNGVLDTAGDSHNIEIDSVDVFGLNTGTNQVSAFVSGVQTDTTNKTSSTFSGTNSGFFFQTNSSNDVIPADGSTNNFTIIHFIDNLSPNTTLKLNLGDNNGGNAAQTSTIVSSATAGSGTYLVSSTFTIFFEMSANGGSSYTVASNDFVGTANGTGSIFQLETTTPEPAGMLLIVTGLAGMCLFRRQL